MGPFINLLVKFELIILKAISKHFPEMSEAEFNNEFLNPQLDLAFG